jgi:molybdate transport system permease protein
MGKSKGETLRKVLLPNIKKSLLTGIVLAFAHTVGEFGVVLMIGGNIPGKTRVASIAIYDEVEALNYVAANFYSMVLFLITFCILLLVYLVNGGYLKKFVR